MGGSYSCENEEGRFISLAVYMEVWGAWQCPISLQLVGAFSLCMKNRQESEILLRVTQPPVDTSEDFQKLHSAHVGTSAHL